jgi:hypothetical protein
MILLHGHMMTLEDIAQIYGLTRERIRQIEERAIYHLCKAIEKSGGTFLDPEEFRLVLKKRDQLKKKIDKKNKYLEKRS